MLAVRVEGEADTDVGEGRRKVVSAARLAVPNTPEYRDTVSYRQVTSSQHPEHFVYTCIVK